MTAKKLDRRKKYSRKVLKDSLLQLLKEKQFSNITVKEICEVADINRSTFYAHYADQYDLLEKIEIEIIEDLQTYLSSYNFKEQDQVLQMTEKLIEYLATKKDEVHVLLNISGDYSFQLRVMNVSEEYVAKQLEAFDHIDKELFSYLITFIISGSVQVMKLWLDGDKEKTPKEMAILITNLINHGIYGTIH